MCIKDPSEVQVMDQIEGRNGEECPWEGGNLSAATKTQLGIFRHDILRLLHRDARERPSMGQFCDMCNRILAGTATQETCVNLQTTWRSAVSSFSVEVGNA